MLPEGGNDDPKKPKRRKGMKEKMTEYPKILLFSGGRTSGYMLRLLLDKYPDFARRFIVCFANTGKERPETIDFVHEVETKWGVKIIWVEYHRVEASSIKPGIYPTPRRNSNLQKQADNGEFTHWFKQVDYATASRNGEPFDELLNWMSVLPNVVSRGCSVQLKIRTVMRYLFSIGIHHFAPNIGIRKDEEQRTIQIIANCDSFEHPEFPLCDAGITVIDVMRFWAGNDFDLRLKNYEGNCDLCFLKAKWKRVLLIKERPSSVTWWKTWEEKSKQKALGRGNNFRLGESYSDLEQLALNPHPELALKDSEDIPCTCVEKAFTDNEDEDLKC